MYVCMYVCMYACMHVCIIYIYIHTYIYILYRLLRINLFKSRSNLRYLLLESRCPDETLDMEPTRFPRRWFESTASKRGVVFALQWMVQQGQEGSGKDGANKTIWIQCGAPEFCLLLCNPHELQNLEKTEPETQHSNYKLFFQNLI